MKYFHAKSKTGDAFGVSLWDFYNNKVKELYHVVERDDGYIDVSGISQYFITYRDWNPNERNAIQYAKGKVLDIGCGAGRHSLHLQKKGLYVLGIDESLLVIKLAKERGLKNAKVLKFEEVSKLKPKKFDTIIMFGNNFGLFGNFNKAKRMLKKLYEITSDDAIIIAESLNPYDTDSPYHYSYHKLQSKRGRMGGQTRLRIRYKNLIGVWFEYLLVSPEELKLILTDTCWQLKKTIKNRTDPLYSIILEKINNF